MNNLLRTFLHDNSGENAESLSGTCLPRFDNHKFKPIAGLKSAVDNKVPVNKINIESAGQIFFKKPDF